MPSNHTHVLKVTFTKDRELAQWSFNGCIDEKCCNVYFDDEIEFEFEGPGEVAECALLCGKMESGLPPSPFKEGNRIDVKNHPIVHAVDQKGLWGFSIAFTASNPDGTTSFYYVPDPEVEVSSHPGSDK